MGVCLQDHVTLSVATPLEKMTLPLHLPLVASQLIERNRTRQASSFMTGCQRVHVGCDLMQIISCYEVKVLQPCFSWVSPFHIDSHPHSSSSVLPNLANAVTLNHNIIHCYFISVIWYCCESQCKYLTSRIFDIRHL